MATTLHTLKTYYVHLVRTDYGAIPAEDAAMLASMAAAIDGGSLTLSAALEQLLPQAHDTTSVANLSYQFFTGGIPSHGGLDYLTSPTGSNPNHLNSAYYQTFSLENRYINFAVNLGKVGEGQPRFAAAYGNLTLLEAAEKAYAEIFGVPSNGKIPTLLAEQVPDGRGGTITRAQYFAGYGGDGEQSIGTKAAVVGWLLAEAAKSGTGPYAQANLAYLRDLAPDDLARFKSDLLTAYAPAPAAAPGSSITFAPNESVTPDAAQASLRSTANDDTIQGSSGLNAGQRIEAGAGADVVTVGGVAGGFIRGGQGDDRITVDTLPASVPILGGGTNGTINGDEGNDLIVVSQQFSNGAVIDGGAGDDTARVAIAAELFTAGANTRISAVEHLEITSFQVQFGGLDIGAAAPNVIDITTSAENLVRLTNIPDGVALVMRDVDTGGGLNASYFEQLVITGMSSSRVGAKRVDIHLDDVTGAVPFTLSGVDSAARFHVASDSALGTVTLTMTEGREHPVIIEGLGRLTASFDGNVKILDATASAGVNLTRFGGDARPYTAVLSAFDDQIALDLLRSTNAAISNYTLGAGADTVTLFQNGVSAPRFGNMRLNSEGNAVDAWAAIIDFSKGQDRLDLGPAIMTVSSGLSTGGATTLEQALINISPQVAVNAVGVFEFGGDTWVYRQDSTVGVNTGDGLIRLIGVTGLTVAQGPTSDIDWG